jgi:hypothetical protein
MFFNLGFGKKKKVIDLLFNLIDKPYKFSIKISGKNASAFIIHVDSKGLYLSEFEPKVLNNLVTGYTRITGSIEFIHKFELHKYIVNCKFLKRVTLNNQNCYLFSIPTDMEIKKGKYEIIPETSDNINLEFKLNNIPQYKKIVKITPEYIYFEGNFSHRSDYFNQIIYGINIKLPLKRFTISAKFIHVSDSLYAFTNFLVNNDLRDTLEQYAIDDFVYKNNIYYSSDNENRKKNKAAKTLKKKVFILQKSETISSIIINYFEETSLFVPKLIRNFEDIESKIINENPFLLIIDKDLAINNKSLFLNLIEKFANLYFLILYNKINDDYEKYGKNKRIIILRKPFDLSEFEKNVEQLFALYSIRKFIPKSTKFLICSKEQEKLENLKNKIRNEVFEVTESHSPDEIFFLQRKQNFQVIIIHQDFHDRYLLTTINRIKSNCEGKFVIIFISVDKYSQSLISSINDSSIFLFKEIPTASKILEIVKNKLGEEK